MAEFTVHDLAQLLRECGGEDEVPDLSGDVVDTEFEDLGYDSLVLFNVICKVQRRYSIQLADDVVVDASTARGLLDVINSRLAA